MLVFDLHHDRMAQRPVTVIADVQAALIFREDDYRSAARQIGLTPAEWNELQQRVLAGEARDEALPRHVDAMAGMRHGRVYALRNVWLHPGERAFVVALDDGKRVYVPRVCGNLSVVRGAPARHVAYAAPMPRVAARVQRPRPAAAAHHPLVAAARVVPPISVLPETAPVVAAAPIVAPIPVPVEAAPVAAAASAGSRLRGIPIIGWLVGIVHAVHSGGGGGGSSVCTP